MGEAIYTRNAGGEKTSKTHLRRFTSEQRGAMKDIKRTEAWKKASGAQRMEMLKKIGVAGPKGGVNMKGSITAAKMEKRRAATGQTESLTRQSARKRLAGMRKSGGLKPFKGSKEFGDVNRNSTGAARAKSKKAAGSTAGGRAYTASRSKILKQKAAPASATNKRGWATKGTATKKAAKKRAKK